MFVSVLFCLLTKVNFMLLSGTGGSNQAVEENEPRSNLTQRGRPVFVCNIWSLRKTRKFSRTMSFENIYLLTSPCHNDRTILAFYFLISFSTSLLRVNVCAKRFVEVVEVIGASTHVCLCSGKKCKRAAIVSEEINIQQRTIVAMGECHLPLSYW